MSYSNCILEIVIFRLIELTILKDKIIHTKIVLPQEYFSLFYGEKNNTFMAKGNIFTCYSEENRAK